MKAGGAASGPRGKAESRDVRRDGRELACDEEQLVETDDSQQCKRIIQQRVLGARNSGVSETRSQLATGATQKEKLSARGRAEGSPEAHSADQSGTVIS